MSKNMKLIKANAVNPASVPTPAAAPLTDRQVKAWLLAGPTKADPRTQWASLFKETV